MASTQGAKEAIDYIVKFRIRFSMRRMSIKFLKSLKPIQ